MRSGRWVIEQGESMKPDMLAGILHRCGTCGALLLSVRELEAHVGVHRAEAASWKGLASRPARLLEENVGRDAPVVTTRARR